MSFKQQPEIVLNSKSKLLTVSLLLLLNILFLLIYEISNIFTGCGFNESVIYTFFYGIEGFDISLFLNQILALSLLILLLGILCFLLPLKYLKNFRYIWPTITLLLVLIISHPLTNNLATLYGINLFPNTFVGELKPELHHDIKLTSKKNIIYIYAESLEATYLSPPFFPNLIPNILELSKNSLYFTNITQVYGTGNTIAGMVASQCSVPFDANGIPPDNEMPFMPNLYCLGDALAENGYNLNYIGGASLKFAGKGNFYRSHSFRTVDGKETILSKQEDKNYISKWGIYDDSMFEYALNKLQKLYSSDKKFGLFLLTLDTHYPDEAQSRSCQDIKYQNGEDSYLNAVHCSDYFIGEFIRKARNLPEYKDTIIILASDHLSPNSGKFENLPSSIQRKGLFLVNNHDIAPRTVDKHSTTLDIFPTLLNILGNKQEKINLGTSMISEHESLVATHEDLNMELSGWSYQLKKFNGN